MTLLRWILLTSLGLLLASVLATWLYGQFAARAQGQASFALPLAAPQARAATLLDQKLGAASAAHAGQSGLHLLSDNLDAFAARALSARSAGRSLDLMYYIWHEDLTGRLLLAEALSAAERGVRVRMREGGE